METLHEYRKEINISERACCDTQNNPHAKPMAEPGEGIERFPMQPQNFRLLSKDHHLNNDLKFHFLQRNCGTDKYELLYCDPILKVNSGAMNN